MELAEIQERLARGFGACVSPVMPGRVESWIEVDAERIAGVARFLADDPDLEFDCLTNLSGVDYPTKRSIEIVYRLFSYRHRHELTVKVDADREQPRVPTVEGVWPAANWLEREVYDLLGVEFVGHSDLRRILLPDDWVGHPLRKDYVEAPEYHGISTIRESILNIPGRS